MANIQNHKGKEQSLMSVLCSGGFKGQLKNALPKHLNVDRMVRIVQTELRKNSALSSCSQQSVLESIFQASQLGLEIGTPLGQAHLIPYGKHCKLIIGYRGMIDLAMRSEKILGIMACVVDELDTFEYELGLTPMLKHKPALKKSGRPTHVYAIASCNNGYKQFEVMSMDEILLIKKKSKTGNDLSSPWNDSFDEMAKKTVIRRLFKLLPVSIEVQRAVAAFDENYGPKDKPYEIWDYAYDENYEPDDEPYAIGDQQDDSQHATQKLLDTLKEQRVQ